MFKVGDEVLVKGEVVEVAKDVTYPIGVRLRCATVPMLFTEDELSLSTKTYEMGLKDAWEMARKLILDKTDGGYGDMQLESDIFGRNTGYSVLRDFTVEEALAKTESYEKEKTVRIGDVIRSSMYDVVVTRVNPYDFRVLYSDGSVGTIRKDEEFTKTGKHIDIEGLLRQIGE